MRVGLFAAGAVGFALGMLCLALVLNIAGALPPRQPHGAPSMTASLPDLTNIPRQPTLEPSPSSAPVPQVSNLASQGDADRIVSADHLIMPIADISVDRLSDTFNETHNGHKHEALDIMAPRGTPVRAAVEGNVVKLFTSKEGGLTVYQFDDSRNLCYYYAHLDHYAAGLREGALLRQGDVLGYVGSTGNASPTNPHLHFAIFRLDPDKKWYHGTAINPLPMLRR